jgi:hypothetical protein
MQNINAINKQWHSLPADVPSRRAPRVRRDMTGAWSHTKLIPTPCARTAIAMERSQTACPRMGSAGQLLPMLNPRCTDHNVARTMTRINGIAYRVLPWALGRAPAEQSGAVAQWRRSREHSSQASSTPKSSTLNQVSGGCWTAPWRCSGASISIGETDSVQTARYQGRCAMRMDQAIFPTNTCSWQVAKVPRYHSGSAHWGSRDPSRAKRSTVAQRLPRPS